MKELELVGDFQVTPHLCLPLYAILLDYNIIHSRYAPGSSTEHVDNRKQQLLADTEYVKTACKSHRWYNAKHAEEMCACFQEKYYWGEPE